MKRSGVEFGHSRRNLETAENPTRCMRCNRLRRRCLQRPNQYRLVCFGGPNTSNFEDVTGSPFPGTVYNGVLTSGGIRYAERFAGQTLGFSGDNDVLSGAPSNPLTLQVGAANQNLDVGFDNGTNDLIPCGLLGCSDPNGYGEGSLAALFPTLVSQVGFQSFFAENVGASIWSSSSGQMER